ncbi:DctP family TRAP transporter solute-binding subunit [Pontibacillus yanchengensis]|uniref:DctP family TRAP transporter solute-binding subunit n=2 Tax=Pontibacillus yanchengensis TaxID=462910 RepID=A0ACC7VCU9_9BACI|nr:TRAP transporter substrate-binding protein [Pontibacillus yanchengensis]MYL32016.1 DctP family TRAP transporter solute-binding subunit [Pontibacillus yanchengensis]MYL52593.1 DctP family TRAP transporter solute-binding subunit [Pontibacillus yanchengensis]
MKKYLSLLILIVVFALAGCSGGGSSANSEGGSSDNGDGSDSSDSLKIVAAHNQTSPENPYQIGMKEFKKVAEEESNGKVNVEVHAGTLGTSESELVEKLKLGAADVVLVSPGFMSKTGIDEIDLFALPYMFDSYDHWEKVVDGEIGDKMADIIKEKSNNDFKLLGYWTAGVRHYYGKKPLQSVSDLEGMKLRTQTSGAVAEYWKKTGAVPTSVAWGELYQALQQGVVDGAENAYPYFVQQNHHKTKNGKYITETGHDYTTRFLLINGKKFENFSKEQKDTIMKAAEAAVKKEREALYSQEEEYKKKAKEDGAEINEIDRQPFIELAKPLQDKVAEEVGLEDMLKKIRDMK